MKHILSTPALIALVGVLATGLSTQAATTTWTGATDSNFGTASNWDNNSPGEDGADELATIGNGGTVNLSSNYTSTDPFRLTVTGNSTLNVSADVTVNRLTSIDAGSTVNILSGADFLMPKVSPGNNAGYTINGTLEISGGTAAFNERLFGNGTIRVVGDEATINWNQISGANHFDFVFDSTGVSGIIGGGPGIGSSGAGPYFALGNSTLSVDGSAYAGAGGSYTLFNTTNLTDLFSPEDISVVGFGVEGIGWTLTQDQASDDIILNVFIVPEPSTLALLGLGGLLLRFSRRRQGQA